METTNSFGSQKEDDTGEKQCRACLEKYSNHQLYSLDSKKLTMMNDGSEQTIAAIYHQCTQLLYEPEDEYCKWICQYCIEKMIDFFQFRKKCIDSYNELKRSKVSKDDSLELGMTANEYAEPITHGMDGGDVVIIKQEASSDCYADHSIEEIEKNLNVNMDVPINDDKNDGDLDAFGDQDEDDDDDDSDNKIEPKVISPPNIW